MIQLFFISYKLQHIVIKTQKEIPNFLWTMIRSSLLRGSILHQEIITKQKLLQNTIVWGKTFQVWRE